MKRGQLASRVLSVIVQGTAAQEDGIGIGGGGNVSAGGPAPSQGTQAIGSAAAEPGRLWGDRSGHRSSRNPLTKPPALTIAEHHPL